MDKEWLVRMTITRNGYEAIVTAATADEARAKVERWEWDDLEEGGSEIVDFSIHSVTLNE